MWAKIKMKRHCLLQKGAGVCNLSMMCPVSLTYRVLALSRSQVIGKPTKFKSGVYFKSSLVQIEKSSQCRLNWLITLFNPLWLLPLHIVLHTSSHSINVSIIKINLTNGNGSIFHKNLSEVMILVTFAVGALGTKFSQTFYHWLCRVNRSETSVVKPTRWTTAWTRIFYFKDINQPSVQSGPARPWQLDGCVGPDILSKPVTVFIEFVNHLLHINSDSTSVFLLLDLIVAFGAFLQMGRNSIWHLFLKVDRVSQCIFFYSISIIFWCELWNTSELTWWPSPFLSLLFIWPLGAFFKIFF